MGRPAAVTSKSSCEHGFPSLLCNACATRAPCVHGMLGDCLFCKTPDASSWFKTTGGSAKANQAAASLVLGVNERFRSAILLASQRTGLDPAAIAAIINAEAAPLSDKKKREQLADEAFRANHPDRDWDKKPLNAKNPGDAAFIKEWKTLFASSAWDERSYNTDSGAAGMTQFLASTWKGEAKRSGTYLNGLAKEKGYIDADGVLVSSKLNDLLELRYDPTASIVAAAEYDKFTFDRVSKEKVTADTKAVDKAFFAKHPERDFVKQPLTSKDAAFIQEWKQLNAQLGTSLVPKDLTDDQKARYLYLCHHEGDAGAIQILSGSLTNDRAKKLLKYNVPDETKRDALVKEHGSESKAYIQWLWSYIDNHIQPSGFRKTWQS